ncbi:MAG: winged helix-turn-helix transcriptional regulator [Thermodesulfobacteriota bacterium]
MNSSNKNNEYRSLLLLDEISRDHHITQRDLSRRLGLALGLVNSYLKNLASRGYITVSTIPKKRYSYYLTPRGLAEKSRLTYRHLQNFTNLYRVARKDFQGLFEALEGTKLQRVVFCGVDETAEIAYLSLMERGLTLAGVIDKEKEGNFFSFPIRRVEDLSDLEYDVVVITSFRGGSAMKEALMEAGVEERRILDISGGDWLKRLP